MGDNSGIQWTTHTWNVAVGCTKVSPGCRHCYMYRDSERFGFDPATVRRTAPTTFNQPIAKHGATATKGTPGAWKWADGSRVFTCSYTDLFHEAIDGYRDEVWAIIRQRPGLIFQVLTKRADRIAAHLPADWGSGYANVHLGVSVEGQAQVQRANVLAGIPAAVRFLSVEPQISRITLPSAILGRLHWLIVGGESGGQEARGFDPEWAQTLIMQAHGGPAVFVKQMGSVWARAVGAKDSHGGDPAEWPEALRVREFPRTETVPEPAALGAALGGSDGR